ncbi:hypothetical protein [Rhodococcus ruber]|uniref:hypothetical protein n=1 Tax=Rhodococcus ruber TaxID=1830 RepID=UPI00034AC123|nr:hypothetical protein [Rhodococcus ruber]
MPGAATAPPGTGSHGRHPTSVVLEHGSGKPPAGWRSTAALTLGSVVSASTAAVLLVAVASSSAASTVSQLVTSARSR